MAAPGSELRVERPDLRIVLRDALARDGDAALEGRAAALEDAFLSGQDLVHLGVVAECRQGCRKHQPVGVPLLGEQPGFLGGIGAALAFEQGHDGAGFQIVQPHQHLSGFHMVAVAHQDLTHDAAVQVLHRLAVGVRRDDAGRHRRTGQRRQRRPGAEAAEPGDSQEDAGGQRPPDRGLFMSPWGTEEDAMCERGHDSFLTDAVWGTG